MALSAPTYSVLTVWCKMGAEGKELILAEKPSVARDIARVLGVRQKGDGFLFGESYIISWAIGHLVTLAEPEEYDPAHKRWRKESLPIIPEKIKLVPIAKTKSQLGVIKQLMARQDVGGIICATDSGREGELIFRYIYDLLGCRKPVKRLWISSMTDDAIRDGFRNLKDGKHYDNLAESAKCRSHADWLVGINASRAFTLKYDVLLSVGRVQTPTLALLVARQQEIDDFVPTNYHEVTASFNTDAALTYQGTYFRAEKGEDGTAVRQTRLETAEQAQEVVEAVSGRPAAVADQETEEKVQPPPLLYDLTELQREANRRFGYSAQKTLDITQSLYEKRKLITYPRTDSRYLSSDMKAKIPDTIRKLAGAEEYAVFAATIDTSKLNMGKRIVDDTKISDHHAIIPTATAPKLQALGAEERAVYDLVARRFLQVFYPNYVYRVTTIITEVAAGDAAHSFVSKGKVVVQEGWTALNPAQEAAAKKTRSKSGAKDDDEGQSLPGMQRGEAVTCTQAKAAAKRTQPPKPYTEATLLSAMEHAGRFVEDEELRESLKDSGLGTPATRAATIERLISVGYVQRSGKAMACTEKGRKLVAAVPPELKTPETTGRWEKGLTSIAKGTLGSERFMQSISRYVCYIVDYARSTGNDITFPEDAARKSAKAKHITAKSLGKCPKCDGGVLENSKAFGCSNWKTGCKFTLWKNSAAVPGVSLTAKAVAQILAEGTCKAATSAGETVSLRLRPDSTGITIID